MIGLAHFNLCPDTLAIALWLSALQQDAKKLEQDGKEQFGRITLSHETIKRRTRRQREGERERAYRTYLGTGWMRTKRS